MILIFDRRKERKKIMFVTGIKIPFAKQIPFPFPVETLDSSLGYEPAYRIDRAKTGLFCLL
jgi:hypothetical protein